jgi:hypothetical protein
MKKNLPIRLEKWKSEKAEICFLMLPCDFEPNQVILRKTHLGGRTGRTFSPFHFSTFLLPSPVLKSSYLFE